MSQENAPVNSVDGVSMDSVIMKKVGMTRIFDENGNHVPVTVLEIQSSKVVQVKTEENDGYSSVKFAYNLKKDKNINAPTKGILKKANVEESFSKMSETRIENSAVEGVKPGDSLQVESFKSGTTVNITGITKGKGFAGVVKKFGFAGGPMSHGSKFHRTTGSIGNRATPGKVWKGKKMPGHMGCNKQTIKNLTIVEMNTEKGYVLIRGSVPGSKNSFVRVTKA